LKATLETHETLLSEKEASLARQEESLRQLREQLNEMSRIYREQSALSGRYGRNSKFWRLCTLIGIPAAMVISAGVTAAVFAGR
jgi:Flp pilus assembly protein TadB